MKPSVGVDRVRGGLGVAEITTHDRIASREDFAFDAVRLRGACDRVGDAHFQPGHRSTRCCASLLLRVVEIAHEHVAAGL